MEHYNSFCEYLCANKYSELTSFMSTLIGAFLGFFFALIIYWIGEWKSRINQKNNENLKAYNTLKRFSFLLESVVKSCRQQNKVFMEHSKDLINKPLDYHLPQLLATNDRERLVHSDDIELYYSFILFDKGNKNKFKDYKNIFNHADFLDKFYTDLFRQNENHHNYMYADLKIIRDNLLAISIKLGLRQKDIQFAKPEDYNLDPEFNFIEKYRTIYIGLKGEGFSDIEPYQNKFLKPLQSELFENISIQKLADEIAYEIANALIKLENILINTISHAEIYAKLDEDENVNSALEFLERIKDKIEEINEP